MDWILSHEDELDATSTTSQNQSVTSEQGSTTSNAEDMVVRSIKCNDCGKLFQTQDEVSFHAVKSGELVISFTGFDNVMNKNIIIFIMVFHTTHILNDR